MGDDTIKKNISKNIGKYREASGMSQKELARRLGVVPSRISNWETGANCPTIDILFEVCEILGVSINDIYGIYPDSKFVLQYDEQEIIKKYRELDEHGIKMFNFMLQEEWERSIKTKMEGQIVLFNNENDGLGVVQNGKIVPYETVGTPARKAAHNDYENEPGEQKKMQEDMELLKRPD